MATTWQEYQEEAAALFRSLGVDSQTNVTIQGVRTKHDIDVLVQSHHIGFDVTWIVECKQWKNPVSKLHVLALREIVADVGADRGILLSESGFQSGAVEAATLTNVRVTSLADVEGTARSEILAMRLRELYDRIEACKVRYWNIPKKERIQHGLRPQVGQPGFSSIQVLELGVELLTKAFRGTYPIVTDNVVALLVPDFPLQFNSAGDLVEVVEPMIGEVEARLSAYKAQAVEPTT